MGILNDAQKKALPDEDAMAKMSWNDLYQLRVNNRGDIAAQEQIAPYEHRAYAREEGAESLSKGASYPLLIAGYQGAKAAGLVEQDDMSTPASLKQIGQGLIGAGEGAAENIMSLWNKYIPK